jgi:nucleoside-diphosphate-sugar epimerase
MTETAMAPMPASRSAPPASRKPLRVLIVGCGDVGIRVLRRLRGRVQVLALTSSVQRVEWLRAAGALPIVGDLDHPPTLARLAGLADAVLHLAPPPGAGQDDPRTQALLAALSRRTRPAVLVYGSTTGVYGDAHGARFDETRAVAPQSDRARRRVAAEASVRAFGRQMGVRVCILRIPGIYAADREGGHPRERLARGVPVLTAQDDVYTNHIHAEDLARACVAALFRGRSQRVVHASDDSDLKMGEYFELAASLCGLPPPQRLPREALAAVLSPMQMSFLRESRRLVNHRLKQELRVRLLYPTVHTGLLA